MAKWSEMKGGAKSALVVVVALLFGGGGYAVWKANQPVTPPVAEGTEAAASSETAAPAEAPKVAETAAAPATVPAVEPAAEPAPAPKAAGLDVVRVEPDGTATIAGQAEPGATISLQLDGAEVGSAVADAAGKFAALLTLPRSDQPRMLTLVQTLADGTVVPGGASLAISATAPAAQVATAAESGTEVAAPVVAEAPAAVIVDDTGVKVAQSGTSGQAVTLGAIAYDPKGDVQLAGKGHPGNIVQIYVDSALVGAADVGADGSWGVTLATVQPGIYTMRLDEVDATGTVVSRFETPFQRETLEALAAAQAGGDATQVASADTAPVADAAVAVDATTSAGTEVATEAVPPTGTDAVAPTSTDTAAATETATASSTAEPAAAPAAQATEAPAADVATAVAPAAEAPAAEVATADAPAAAKATATDAAAPAAVETAPAATVTAEVAATADATTPATTSEAAPAAAPATAAEPAKAVTVTVQPGFTLWAIARSQLGDGILYVQIFDANKGLIRNPDLIYPGQVFVIPASK